MYLLLLESKDELLPVV